MNLLVERHLKGIPFRETLTPPQANLFQQGEIRFGGRIVLREHFRCMPEIIQFSSDLCYQAKPLWCLRQYPPKRLEPVKATYVKTGFREGGTRAINKPEAEALADRIAHCCGDPAYAGKSMGVVSLLGDIQARLIQGLLAERLAPEEIEMRHLDCGDAYAFQGDERDVMFLSMVAAPNEKIGALTREPDKQRFNVAASRARDQMWLFHSVTVNDLHPDCVRRTLLAYVQNPYSPESRVPPGLNIQELRSLASAPSRGPSPPAPFDKRFDSWFEVDVFLEIVGRGFRCVPQYQVSKYRIDLVVESFGKNRLAVECDGECAHPLGKWDEDTFRQRVLERAGWTFWRVRGSDFYRNKEKALAPLWEKLGEMGISHQSEDCGLPAADCAKPGPVGESRRPANSGARTEGPRNGFEGVASRIGPPGEEQQVGARTAAVVPRGEQLSLVGPAQGRLPFAGNSRGSTAAGDGEFRKQLRQTRRVVLEALVRWLSTREDFIDLEKGLLNSVLRKMDQRENITESTSKRVIEILAEAKAKGFTE